MSVEITSENLAQATAHGLTLVDFWADWCGPCHMLEPVLEELEDDFAGQINFASLDVEEHQNLAQQFNVMSIPTLILFKDGVAKEKITGYKPKKALSQYLEQKISE
ncbi:thiol-disulfide isomerase / thioredoxin [Ligilactobacillus salitolerans]|uniref:Thioredoxin n=1 Tax=Ligilactobacillus salitolerans TaxID=1808352 RepID=A0A401ISL3_9LACO|nr:thioredoxin [Ligilactobacillus salitolerans]GBG94518.1 thiol-disulfide isomerase / thioredoxin [Ligilactobacillus salitolerans]